MRGWGGSRRGSGPWGGGSALRQAGGQCFTVPPSQGVRSMQVDPVPEGREANLGELDAVLPKTDAGGFWRGLAFWLI